MSMSIQYNSAPSSDELMTTVLNLLSKVVDEKPSRIKPDTALFSALEMFDSFALMELVLRLEATFDLSIPDEDLDRDAFSSPQAIVAYLHRRLQSVIPRDGHVEQTSHR